MTCVIIIVSIATHASDERRAPRKEAKGSFPLPRIRKRRREAIDTAL